MRLGRVRCQVVEVPRFTPNSRLADGYCRDLLPWADPYIAGLMAQLHGRQDMADVSEAPAFNDGNRCYSAAEEWLDDEQSELSYDNELDDNGSHLDFPPVVGGWPLLSDDVTEEEPC